MKSKTGFSIIILSSLIIMFFGNHVCANISGSVYFQSILMDSNETVASDGEYTVTFSIWDGDQETDNKLWEEQHTVSVEDGIYSVSLGSIVSFLDPDQNGDQSDALTFAVPYYLGVKIQNDDYLKFGGKFPGLRSVVTAFRSSTSAGNLVRSVSSSYTITEQDDVVFVSGNSQITLPSADNLHGRIITIKNVDPTHDTSILTVNSDTIDNINRDPLNSGTALVLPDQFDDLTVISNGQNWISLGLRDRDNLTVAGTTESTHLIISQTAELLGNTTIGDSSSDALTMNAVLQGQAPLIFEGASADAIQTKIIVENPTEARQITIPDSSGTIALKNCTIINDSRTLTTSDEGIILISSTTNKDISITLPDPTGHPGLTYSIKKADSSSYTSTIMGNVDGISNPEIVDQNGFMTVFSDGSAWYKMAENISTGSIGQPVVDGSEDTNRSKLVSDKIIYDLTAHMNSDHSSQISGVVDKAFVEGVLTGEINSHHHPSDTNPETLLNNPLFPSAGTLKVNEFDYGLAMNYILKDGAEKYASIISYATGDITSYGHAYSSGDRRGTITVSGISNGVIDGIQNTYTMVEGTDGAAVTFTFPENVMISEISSFVNKYATNRVVAVINSELVYDSNNNTDWLIVGSFEPVISNQVTLNFYKYGTSPVPAISEVTFKLGELSAATIDIQYSGELLSTTPVKLIKSRPSYIEYHFESISVDANLFQSQKGYENLWPLGMAKILKMDCYSSSVANINCNINGTPVFQNSAQTGSGWAYSGVVTDGANVLNHGDELEISSDASGTNLFVRIWYILPNG